MNMDWNLISFNYTQCVPVFSSNSKTTSPLDSNNNNFNVPSRTNFRLQFSSRAKGTCYDPHNSNATTCSGRVVTLRKSSLKGGRDDLPLRFLARTSSPPLQYCWRLETGFLIACFFSTFFLTFRVADCPPLGPLSPKSSLANWIVLATRRCSLWTGPLRRPLCVLRITVRTRPSFHGTNLSTRAIGHLPTDTLSSKISTTSLILRAGFSHTHLYRTDNWCRFSPHQSCQKGLRSFCWYRYRYLVVPSFAETSSAMSGKRNSDLPSARWGGVMGVDL